jgi:LPXTG-motif cell wall-anchored protein
MKRKLVTISAAVLAAAAALGSPVYAGGVDIVDGVCSTGALTMTWKHIDEANRDRLTGVDRKIEILSVKTFEETPKTLTVKEVSPGVWTLDAFSAVGEVIIDVELRETITAPRGEPVIALSAPRVVFNCLAAPPVTTTTTTTTTAAPGTAPAPTVAPTPAPSVSLPVITQAGAATTVASSALPETGSNDSALLLTAVALLAAGVAMTVTSRMRRNA